MTGGDPRGGAPIVRTTPARIAELLADAGPELAVSTSTVRRRFDDLDIRLYRNVQSLSGPRHPDRERQFQFLRPTIDRLLDAGLPVVSIDAKKRETVGAFQSDGQTWGVAPRVVNDHDFPHLADHQATPFGIDDLAANHGFVQVGLSSNTPAFAVAALRAYWVRYGCRRYRGAEELLVLADGGGANGHRLWLWKLLLQQELSDRYGLAVTVCHYPTGASKWNPIEHRLFGPISQNWAGEPLTSLDKMLGLIRGTGLRGEGTLGEGTLRVDAALDPRPYLKGLKAPKNPAALLNLTRNKVCPNWNYTLRPRPESS